VRLQKGRRSFQLLAHVFARLQRPWRVRDARIGRHFQDGAEAELRAARLAVRPRRREQDVQVGDVAGSEPDPHAGERRLQHEAVVLRGAQNEAVASRQVREHAGRFVAEGGEQLLPRRRHPGYHRTMKGPISMNPCDCNMGSSRFRNTELVPRAFMRAAKACGFVRSMITLPRSIPACSQPALRPSDHTASGTESTSKPGTFLRGAQSALERLVTDLKEAREAEILEDLPPRTYNLIRTLLPDAA